MEDRIHHRARALALAFATLAAIGATTASADIYIGLGSGRAHIEDRILGASDEFDGDATSEHYFLGFELGRHTRFELGRVDLGEISDTITVGAVPTPTTVAIDGHTYSFVFSEPIARDLALYLRAGVFEWDREVVGPPTAGNTSNSNGLFGIGASLRISHDLAIRAEYQRFEVGRTNVDTPMLALVYRF